MPIFMVEGTIYSYAKYSSYYSKYLAEKNYAFHKNYLKLKQENPKNLYYIDSKNLYGPDNEGTVDGSHYTDIGFYFYAQKLEPYLKAVLNGKSALSGSCRQAISTHKEPRQIHLGQLIQADLFTPCCCERQRIHSRFDSPRRARA